MFISSRYFRFLKSSSVVEMRKGELGHLTKESSVSSYSKSGFIERFFMFFMGLIFLLIDFSLVGIMLYFLGGGLM